MSPHFFHNALNTIYSLANDENAPTTQTAILELSKMMRYWVKNAFTVPINNYFSGDEKITRSLNILFFHGYSEDESIKEPKKGIPKSF